ncbi:MAG: cation:proton antiporter, partial [Nanoarchaeota archaeon]|nr:cation:proton antiporter [Nanoarchaeota archaeon]
MKTIYRLLLCLAVIAGISFYSFSQHHNENQQPEESTVVAVVDNSGQNNQGHTEDIADKSAENKHGKGEHKGGMEPLFFIIIALLIGAATRHFFRKIPLPFTVLLLLIGFGLGVLNRIGSFEGWGETISISLEWAGHIDPHALLFIFLPILVFEAAFAMDLHTFKKTATNSIILAVPGIVVAIILSAALAILLKVLNVGLY